MPGGRIRAGRSTVRSPMMAHDIVLFDLDGTLSDPLEGIGKSINFALSHFGFPLLDFDEVRKYIGPPVDQAFRQITGQTSPPLLAALVERYRERYADVGYSENVLYPGVSDALARLRGLGVVKSQQIESLRSRRHVSANSLMVGD